MPQTATYGAPHRGLQSTAKGPRTGLQSPVKGPRTGLQSAITGPQTRVQSALKHIKKGIFSCLLPLLVLSLQDLCCRSIVSCTPVHLVDKLPLPIALKSHLKSFSMANGLNARMMHGRSYSVTANSTNKRNSLKKSKPIRPPQSPSQSCARNSCKIS